MGLKEEAVCFWCDRNNKDNHNVIIVIYPFTIAAYKDTLHIGGNTKQNTFEILYDKKKISTVFKEIHLLSGIDIFSFNFYTSFSNSEEEEQVN